MKKTTAYHLAASLLIVGCLSMNSLSQSKLPGGLYGGYDKFKDVSRIGFDDTGANSAASLIAWFEFNGTSLTSDVEQFFLAFSPHGRCYGYCFTRAADLILIIDGQRVKAGTGSNRLSDVALIRVDRSILTRLAASTRTEFQVGAYEGIWKEKNASKFKALLDYGTVRR